MKLFRARAGELGDKPMWVAMAAGQTVAVDASLAKVLRVLAGELVAAPQAPLTQV